MVLSGAQVAGYAHAAGFSGNNLVVCIACCKVESGWNAYAHNSVPPDDSYGLMQINMIGSMGPSRRAQYQLKSNDDLFNPLTNMRVAFLISGGGQNFNAWTSFTSGDYLKHTAEAQQAVKDLQAQGPQFEHDLVATAGQSASSLDVFLAGLGAAVNVSGGGILGLGNVPAAASSAANAASAIPNAITNGINSLNDQFAKIGGNFLAIAVAIALLVVGIVLLMHDNIGSAVKAVKPAL